MASYCDSTLDIRPRQIRAWSDTEMRNAYPDPPGSGVLILRTSERNLVGLETFNLHLYNAYGAFAPERQCIGFPRVTCGGVVNLPPRYFR